MGRKVKECNSLYAPTLKPSTYFSPRSSMYLTTSPTVCSFSASSSGISAPNSSSNAMTNSTVSSESAPRSSMNFASGVTWSGLTPSCSTMISFTRSCTDFSAIIGFSLNSISHCQAAIHRDDLPGHITRHVTREEQHCIGYILDRTQTTQRDPRFQRFLRLFTEGPRHVGHNESRCDRVRGNVPRRQLASD